MSATVSLSYSAKEGEKLGLFVLNMGGPTTIEDVEPFLFNLFNDPDIIRLPPVINLFQPFIARMISRSRAPKSAVGYEKIGGGSPLFPLTKEQGDAIAASLAKRGISVKVYVGMRYWHPFTESAIQKIKCDGITKLVILPLYPQYSISTTGSSLRCIKEEFHKDDTLENLPLTVVYRFAARPGYVSAMADLIQMELGKFQDSSAAKIFFSAHGVPKKYVTKALDPYKAEMEQCVRLIMATLRSRGVTNDHILAYQSRVGPVEWLKPYTSEVIPALGASGCNGLLAVPISFVSEHIETLDEIDREYQELARHSGIKEWGRVPALCSYPPFIEDLAAAVEDAFSDAEPIVKRDIHLDGKPDSKAALLIKRVVASREGKTFLMAVSISVAAYVWFHRTEPSLVTLDSN
nr:ferrochelatase-2 (FC), chloroplastic [Polytomella parva]|eukprot:CAMPEP_0175040666 /NCGR_PEP_ID=MMETSP0052_2-20121109/1407_1 /TAXON_ID=51329 ORGANISM="Polytomella parva, Strain SAG 63-3" /NCGR_SAMPLE_ID=MMETSP0052_2 /ASSEMBLY_ACC=CAM_ASM_000194 /LENGTH=404 /DNA_ID=CAMNT_0016302937 /DNA_START=97 /DNA_END=1311 /DNA_ORIENTATION=+